MKFLKWFIQDDVQQKWADLGGYTCSAKVLESEAFRKATPYNEAFYQTMFKVKELLGGAGICGTPDPTEPAHLPGRRRPGKGPSQETLDAPRRRLEGDLRQVRPRLVNRDFPGELRLPGISHNKPGPNPAT